MGLLGRMALMAGLGVEYVKDLPAPESWFSAFGENAKQRNRRPFFHERRVTGKCIVLHSGVCPRLTDVERLRISHPAPSRPADPGRALL